MCASLRFRVRERPEKYFLLSVRRRELYEPGPRFFYYMIDMSINTRNLTVCNSGQYIQVTCLGNFFFALQDLIDKIDSYFQRIAFRRSLLLIGF